MGRGFKHHRLQNEGRRTLNQYRAGNCHDHENRSASPKCPILHPLANSPRYDPIHRARSVHHQRRAISTQQCSDLLGQYLDVDSSDFARKRLEFLYRRVLVKNLHPDQIILVPGIPRFPENCGVRETGGVNTGMRPSSQSLVSSSKD